MPIYEYTCKKHGTFEKFMRAIPLELPVTVACPECGEDSWHIISAPARIDIERTWEDRANDEQCHGEYEQAKAQIENMSRGREEFAGKPPLKITEEGIQVAAREIHKRKTQPKAPPEVRQAARQRKLAEAAKKKQPA
jgi:putative FmdB family regulatory protein